MAQIGNVKEINEVKACMEELRTKGLIKNWELPYENLLTRLSAAIFFISISENIDGQLIWTELKKFNNFSYQANEKTNLSKLEYQIEFKESVK